MYTLQQQKNIGDYENIHSVNSGYLIIGKADGYIEESNRNKYLVFAQIKIKKYWQNLQNFGMELNI